MNKNKEDGFYMGLIAGGLGVTISAIIFSLFILPPKESDSSCYIVGDQSHDPMIYNLRELGVKLDYEDGKWKFQDDTVGESVREDFGFELCLPKTLSGVYETERQRIVDAGGYEN